jgi:predicted aldo/keto reductase-like oxidoreductase
MISFVNGQDRCYGEKISLLMKENHFGTSRRNFLKSTLTLPVALAAAPSLLTSSAGAADAPASADVLPRRQLGKSGPQVTMLCMGGMMSALSPDYLDIAWSMGIRYFDTADCYMKGESEKIVGQWLSKYPERRKEIFLVSKDHPHQGPEQLLKQIDTRLAAIGTPYLDAFYIHGIGTREYGEDSVNWPKSDAYKKVAEKLKSSGKVKMVGFSCHDGRLTDYLNSAAQGGFLDIIMLAFNPFYPKGGPLDQALDAAHAAGIGLVAMKTMRSTRDVPKRLPEFDKLGLTTHQAVLQSAWSDPRISVVCNMIDNVDQMQNSTAAARSYKEPLKFAHMELLRETIFAGRRTMCTGCPSCENFARKTDFAFHDIARFVTYYEQDGNTEARSYYQALAPQHRDASKVSLAALRDGCHFKTDYPEIVRRAERYFA